MKRKESSAKENIEPETSGSRRKPVKKKSGAASAALPEKSKRNVKAAPAAAARKTARRPAAGKVLKVPPILLEGDQPAPPVPSGPGEKYVLSPAPAAVPPAAAGATLPESYGTRKLFLAARDPHWLYAHWDLTAEQQRRYNARAHDRHLVLRIYTDAVAGRPVSEVHVHPESRHWFIHVDRADTKYAAELGYYSTGQQWTRVCLSDATLTPPDTVSDQTETLFATIPMDLPFARLLALVKEAVHENGPLAGALEQLRAAGHPQLPPTPAPPGPWTAEQEKALAAVLSLDEVRRVWIGSLEITELIRRHLARQISSAAFSPFGAGASLFSPFGPGPAEKGFWFNVNAELIIYGATEPDASVTLGGRPVKLRADGSFSYHFALPDGWHELPITAVSADQTEARAVQLKFSRATDYRGDVGVHPQNPELKAPAAGNVA